MQLSFLFFWQLYPRASLTDSRFFFLSGSCIMAQCTGWSLFLFFLPLAHLCSCLLPVPLHPPAYQGKIHISHSNCTGWLLILLAFLFLPLALVMPHRLIVVFPAACKWVFAFLVAPVDCCFCFVLFLLLMQNFYLLLVPLGQCKVCSPPLWCLLSVPPLADHARLLFCACATLHRLIVVFNVVGFCCCILLLVPPLWSPTTTSFFSCCTG